jgi:hypothetical protein
LAAWANGAARTSVDGTTTTSVAACVLGATDASWADASART